MFVQVDTEVRAATLEDPDNCEELHVLVVGDGDPGAVDETIAAVGAGRLVGSDAFLSVRRLEEWAAGRVGSDWPERFARMLDYAGSKGWMNDDRTYVRAHLKPA